MSREILIGERPVLSIIYTRILLTILLSFFFCINSISSSALEIEPDAVFVRVIDTGAGLATITRMPGDHYMVYDAGHWNGVDIFMDRIREIIPSGGTIDLLVISHSDSDHLAGVDDLLKEYRVIRVLRTGLERDTQNWKQANNKILEAKENQGTRDINLQYFDFPDGATYRFGDVYLTKVTGFHQAPATWDLINTSERNNANSVIIRLYFQGGSILYTGDAVGRHNGQAEDISIATEKYMIENSPVIIIDSDVLIAPHHGADNGSSTDFIKAVSPEWVIFSAGHDHSHPRQTAAERYLNQGISIEKMFRTDLGDDENDLKEWSHGRIDGNIDPKGDDDVDILIRPSGEILVEYRDNQ